MTPAEVGMVLTKCAAFDSRTIGKADVGAWFEAIGDLNFDDSRVAVTAWYRSNRDRIMPSDVRTEVKKIRAERIRNGPSEGELMTGVDANGPIEDWLRIKRERLALVADGRPVPELRAIRGGAA